MHPTEYADVIIQARRADSRAIRVGIAESPAGTTQKAVRISFPAAEAARIRGRFGVGIGGDDTGAMTIRMEQAADLGRRLAEILLPPPIFKLVALSLAGAVRRPRGGIRVRLDLDDELIDLPWEYVYRPDRAGAPAVSGFLLLDPRISMVRGAPDPAIAIRPISGRQELEFLGTLWEGRVDGWKVIEEYQLLTDALRPVSSFLSTAFTEAGRTDRLTVDARTAVFHYAGHCHIQDGYGYLVREMPTRPVSTFADAPLIPIDEVATATARAKTRLVVLSACNSGLREVALPLVAAGVPAVLGVNGVVASQSTIEFCSQMYQSLAVGLSLDEAIAHARLHVLEWGRKLDLFDWGLYMVYMPSPEAVLFPRPRTRSVASHQKQAHRSFDDTASATLQMARDLDGLNFGTIMSELTRRRVLILGRFSRRRLPVLEELKKRLAEHPNRYVPELFTFRRPKSRDLVEAIVGFAALSRFVVADLSEPRSVQDELRAIVPQFPSLPVVPIINERGKEYATFSSIKRNQNVVQPTVRYRGLGDLAAKLEGQIVPAAEEKLAEVRPDQP